jgi:tyrosine-protein phosphatase SIW14
MRPSPRVRILFLRPSFVAIALALLAGCQSTGKPIPGVGNFAVADEGALYRGAQPTAQGIDTLKTRGVRTIVNLRDDPNPAEHTWVERANMLYVQIPSSASVVDPRKLEAFLEVMESSPRPVFVHCRAGCDRTGLNVAVYHIVVDHWSHEDAARDLYAHGYHWLLFPGIGRYVKTFDATAAHPATNPARHPVADSSAAL